MVDEVAGGFTFQEAFYVFAWRGEHLALFCGGGGKVIQSGFSELLSHDNPILHKVAADLTDNRL